MIQRHDPSEPRTVVELPGEMAVAVIGVKTDRPDGAVEVSMVRRDQTAVDMEVGWRVAAQLAVALFAAAIRASDRAGVSTEAWQQHIDAAWAASARPIGGAL